MKINNDEQLQVESCPFKRSIKFQDTIHLIGNSLKQCIDNMHIAIKNEKIPLDIAFRTTKEFADSQGFSQEQFKMITLSKMEMPHEKMKSYQDLIQTTEIPLKKDFYSSLKNTNISDESYSFFSKMWNELKIENLLHLYAIYNILDCCIYR